MTTADCFAQAKVLRIMSAMPVTTDSATARTRIELQLTAIARLRGSGPNPFDYNQWDARTQEVLTALYGAESEEMGQYMDAAGIRGRLPGVRGSAENMTLNIHGQWGIHGRLERAEVVLKDLLAALPA
jgi:hypothetical protein